MSKIIKESVLFRTSAASDIQCSGGNITVAGLKSVSKKDITGIYQTLYKAEVAKVSTVTTSAVIPAASTTYQVVVYDPARFTGSYTESPKVYKYKTSNDLSVEGATAALQREYINVQLIAAINADDTCHATAATLTGGAGFTVTDDGGYYPVFSQGMTNVKGINAVYTIKNTDGTGFAGTEAAITTAAVYSYGTGANLLASNPIVSFVFGNLISGVLDAPPVTSAGLTAVTGQNYDGFIITSLKAVPAVGITGQLAYQDRLQTVFVDNGTGSSVTNLAGFLAFERVFHKLIAEQYASDSNAITEFFDKGYVMQANPGITPYTGTIAGTADVMKFFTTPYGTKLEQYNINAQTIFAPLEVAGGLQIEQDVTATDGAHYCGGTLAFAPNSFVVGKTPFMCYARVVAGDWTDAFFMVGFRKKAVYAADYTTYDDLGAIGTQVSAANDYVATQGNINNGTMKETVSSTAIAADGVSVSLRVYVDINGVVTAYRNGVSFPIYSVGTTPLVFDAGDEMIPFFQYINLNSSASTLTFSEFIAVASNSIIA